MTQQGNSPDSDEPAWQVAHRRALAQKLDSYIDPVTGYTVFTETYHLARGKCCGSGCRHCPYDHEAVDPGSE